MRERFQLALNKPASDPHSEPEVVTVSDYLEARRNGTALWEPDLDSSVVSLEVEGHEWLGTDSGWVNKLAAQFLPARDRLAQDQPALIRFADYDQVGEYLLFEPQGDRVSVIKFDISEKPPRYDFPLPQTPDESHRLYAYVERNRDQLDIEIGPVEVNRTTLMEALEREARLADQLYRELGAEVSIPMLPDHM